MDIFFKEATQEERQIYFREEWKESLLPSFITETLEAREFAFDRDGSGPRDRYNRIYSIEELAGFLRRQAPYGAYTSVSFYENPAKREGYMNAEMVFDIDAKDLPVRNCLCEKGKVCKICLEDAKDLVLEINDTLRDDFGLEKTHFIFSGRGYHIRILDKEAMDMDSQERGSFLDYVAGGVVPAPELMDMENGYSRTFRQRLKGILDSIKEENIISMGFQENTAQSLVRKKSEISEELDRGILWNKKSRLRRILKSDKNTLHFLESIRSINAGMLDAKVSIDVKRILRMPSSLHSKASMVCMEVKNMENFNPLEEAVPKFVFERKE